MGLGPILSVSHIVVIIDNPSEFIYIDEQPSHIFLPQNTFIKKLQKLGPGPII
jgi:hypothetical protein